MSANSHWLKMFCPRRRKPPPEPAPELAEEVEHSEVEPCLCPVCGDPSSFGYTAGETGEVIVVSRIPSYPVEEFAYNLGAIYSRETIHQALQITSEHTGDGRLLTPVEPSLHQQRLRSRYARESRITLRFLEGLRCLPKDALEDTWLYAACRVVLWGRIVFDL